MDKLYFKDIRPPVVRWREGLWACAFLAVLAGLLIPVLVWTQTFGHEISVAEQALLILIATWLCQWLRKKPLSDATGRIGVGWVRQFLAGSLLGTMLMLAPAAVLAISGAISWTVQPAVGGLVATAVFGMLAVAVAEELLFRGFLFQRLIGAIGVWPAQLAMAGLFVLTHLANPGMEGSTKLIAGLNIFVASLLFGSAYLRTNSLAMPIAIHWCANLVQGPLLGLGVSGTSTSAVLAPVHHSTHVWWTGDAFGLEASIPGLIIILAALLLFQGLAVRSTARQNLRRRGANAGQVSAPSAD